MRRASTLTRLTLALLALVGFAAPTVVRHVDPVTQAAGAGPSEAEVVPAPADLQATSTARALSPEAVHAAAGTQATRKYLWHRAWLC